MQRPQLSEYAEYYDTYVSKVPDDDVFQVLAEQVDRTARLLGSLPAEWETYRYQPGKWSIREVMGHVVDVERVFGYRALSMARADPTPLPGMDENGWAVASNAGDRPLASLLEELRAARRSSLAMFGSFDDAAWGRSGVASDCPFSVRTFPYVVAGHEIHHRRVIEERYLMPLREQRS